MQTKALRLRVAGLFIDRDRILFVEHTKQNKSALLLPGGQVQYGETMPAALKREFSEELRVDAEVQDLAYLGETIDPAGSRHLIQAVFHVSLDPSQLTIGEDPAVKAFHFISIDDLDQVDTCADFIYPPASIYPSQHEALSSLIDRLKNTNEPAQQSQSIDRSAQYFTFPWKK